MKTLYTMLLQDLHRSVGTPRFLCAAFGIAFCNFFSAYWDISIGAGDCVAYLYMLTGVMGIENLYLLLAVLPGALLFYLDEESQFTRSVILRSGRKPYLLSKVLTTFVSAALAILAGDLIFLATTSLQYPLMSDFFRSMLVQLRCGEGYDQVFILVNCALKMLCGSAFALLTLKISVNVRNIFVVLFLPYIIYYVWARFSTKLYLPPWLNVDKITEGFAVGNGWAEGFGFGVGFFLVFSVLCAVWFIFSAERRMQNA